MSDKSQTVQTDVTASDSWEPPSAPLDMPRQVLESERGVTDRFAMFRLPWARTRA